MQIPGIIVPPLTPFNPDLEVDYAALEKEVDYVIEVCKASAVTAAGVETQEYHYLPHQERRELVRRTLEFVDGRCPVMVGVSHPSIRTAIELAHLAEDLGAYAIQVLAPLRPFGGPPSQEDTLGYFDAIARETSLPIVVYHNPGPGAELPPAWMVDLARMDRVQYFKDSSRDLRRVSLLIEDIDRAGHAHYFTTMEMLLITLLLGGSGATMPPPASQIAAELLTAYAARDPERVIECQRKFSLFPSRWLGKGLAPVMKAAMRLIGLDLGDPFPPFQPLTEEETRELANHLKSIGLRALVLMASLGTAFAASPLHCLT